MQRYPSLTQVTVTVSDYAFSVPFSAMTWQARHNVVCPRHGEETVNCIGGSHVFRPKQGQIDYSVSPELKPASNQSAVAKYDSTTLTASAQK